MPSIAQGVVKQTRVKRQTAKGTLAGASGGQIIRRTDSSNELKKDTFDTSDEITSSQQLTSVQHGSKEIASGINGLLSPGTYADMIASIMRRDFATITPIAGASITISGTGPTYTVARAAGSFLTDGVKIGHVIRLSVGTFNAANSAKNLLVTGVTALSLTVLVVNGSALVAEGPIATSTVTVVGKTTYVAPSSQTKIYYTVEDWYSDLTTPVSEVNQDVVWGSVQITIPGQGNATVQLQGVGLDQPTVGNAAYFTTPTSETSSAVCSAAMGALLVNGVQQAVITNIQYTIDGQAKAADSVVGSQTKPDVFRKKVMIKGQFTAYYDSDTAPALFRNATDFAIVGVLANSLAAAADFVAYAFPMVKLTSSTPADAEDGLKRTYQFTAEYYSAGGSGQTYDQTTMTMQDSLA